MITDCGRKKKSSKSKREFEIMLMTAKVLSYGDPLIGYALQILLGRNSHLHFTWMRDGSPKRSMSCPRAESRPGPEPELKAQEVLTRRFSQCLHIQESLANCAGWWGERLPQLTGNLP